MVWEQFLTTLAAVAAYDIAKTRYTSYMISKSLKNSLENMETLKKIINTMNGVGFDGKAKQDAGTPAKDSSAAAGKRKKEGKAA